MTIDEAIKDLEYSSKQLEMEIKSGLWIKGSESELRCKESITIDKQYIEWLKELKDLRKENKVLIQKCNRLIKEKGADVQPVKHGRWIVSSTQTHIEVTYECSECQHEAVGEYEKTPFCGGCGARMEGDSE